MVKTSLQNCVNQHLNQAEINYISEYDYEESKNKQVKYECSP